MTMYQVVSKDGKHIGPPLVSNSDANDVAEIFNDDDVENRGYKVEEIEVTCTWG